MRIIQSPASTARYDSPSLRKHQPKPTVATSRPAIAGPMTRDIVIKALFKLTAFVMLSAGTISTTNDRRAGLSKATVKPPTSATA